MALATDPELRNRVIYSMFVRNHTTGGTFRAAISDLPRIANLGVDYVWLMPIHPIGELGRKESLGSPYAIRDYRAVNPEYGTIDDFLALVEAIHANGMLCMIDVVYNHTSPDSVLWGRHPGFFYRRPDGGPGNRVGEWTDVIDLDYTAPGLWDYQIDSLCCWARVVDGFRCDVAPLVPIEFWGQARDKVARVNPGCIWLAETVHRSFGELLRRGGTGCARDTEIFSVFDMEYEYDVREAFESYLGGKTSLGHWLDLLDFQESVYPDNYDKLRFLENHDTARIASLTRGSFDLENLTAMSFFLKGTTLIYAGQEVASEHQPSLFDRDAIEWDTGRDLSNLMRRLTQIKHEVLGARDFISLRADDEHDVAAVTRDDGTRKLGIFSLRGQDVDVDVELSDGTYENLVDGREVVVRDGVLRTDGKPVIVCA